MRTVKFPRVWVWKSLGFRRRYQCCRVLARSTSRQGFNAHSALIEFEDGFRAVVGWRGLRKLVSRREIERQAALYSEASK